MLKPSSLLIITAALLLLTIAAVGVKTNPASAKDFTVGGFRVWFAGDEAFFNFTGLMPGDKVTKALFVKNNAVEPRELKLIAKNASGSPDPQKLLGALKLEIKHGADYTFGGPGHEKTVQDLFVSEDDAITLGIFADNTENRFDFNIEFDPTVNNDYNGLISHFDLVFGNRLATVPIPAVLGAETEGSVLGAETGGGWLSALLGLTFLCLGLYLRRLSTKTARVPRTK